MKTYPPQLKMSIHKPSTCNNFSIPVKINGCAEDGQLNIDLLSTGTEEVHVCIACNANLLSYNMPFAVLVYPL
jgi:hypothetical protein